MRVLALVLGLSIIGCAAHKHEADEPPRRATPKAGVEVSPDVYPQLPFGPDGFTQARTAYELGRYGEAIGYFKGAYLLKPDPAFLFNIAQLYRHDGKCRAATVSYTHLTLPTILRV